MHRWILVLLLTVSLATGCSSGGGDGSKEVVPPAEDAGGSGPGLLLPLLLALGLMTDWTPEWEDCSIASVHAPDEYTVKVAYDGRPPADRVALIDSYRIEATAIESDAGVLDVTAVTYDGASRIATLTTRRQKLGFTYTLAVEDGGAPVAGLDGTFPAADTATLWATDFDDPGFTKKRVVTHRAAVGTHCVVYVEEGFDPAGVDAAVTHFDEQVFPTETALLIDAPDFDENGRILILGLDGKYNYGGFFDGTNAYPNSQTMAWWGIPSNEMDMIHINVSFGDFDSYHTIIPHEFGHLLYHERHGFGASYWAYHDEGLAECATRAVNGDHPTGVDYYMADYQGLIGAGLSMVNWTYALYENYVVAYLFWSYIASQLEGVATYGDLFDLDVGSPSEVNRFIEENLGIDMAEAQMNQMIATWVQADSGPYSYGDMVTFPEGLPPTAPTGVSSVDLEPYAGTYFLLDAGNVEYPGTEGPNIVYAGLDGFGGVDLEAPFDVTNGALLVFNTNFTHTFFVPEHSGPDFPALSASRDRTDFGHGISLAWLDPPPFNPEDTRSLHRWREMTQRRMATLGW